jgi:hypothetical protein
MNTITTEQLKIRLSELSKESLGEIYHETVGYNPFLDDQNITSEQVVKILQEMIDEGEHKLEIPNSVYEREGF